MSHYVQSVRLARYDSETGRAVVEEINDGVTLKAARCSLGCLGVILSLRIECREQYQVEEQFGKFSNVEDLLAAEQDFPLQQFYLFPWEWSCFVQHRKETDKPRSTFAWLYHFYRYWVFDVAMHLLIFLLVRGIRSHSLIRAAFRWIVPATVIRHWKVVADSSEQLVMGHEFFRHIEMELFVKKDTIARCDAVPEGCVAVPEGCVADHGRHC